MFLYHHHHHFRQSMHWSHCVTVKCVRVIFVPPPAAHLTLPNCISLPFLGAGGISWGRVSWPAMDSSTLVQISCRLRETRKLFRYFQIGTLSLSEDTISCLPPSTPQIYLIQPEYFWVIFSSSHTYNSVGSRQIGPLENWVRQIFGSRMSKIIFPSFQCTNTEIQIHKYCI